MMDGDMFRGLGTALLVGLIATILVLLYAGNVAINYMFGDDFIEIRVEQELKPISIEIMTVDGHSDTTWVYKIEQ